jgi:6-phosphogluconolactonase
MSRGARAPIAARAHIPAALLGIALLAGTLPPAAGASSSPTLYASNNATNNVAAFSTAADGTLSAVGGSPFAAGGGPAGVSVTPDGAHLYLTNASSNNVTAYSISADGAITEVVGSPFATGTDPVGVAVSPDGGHLFVANRLGANVSVFSINATSGSLTPVTGSPFSAGANPIGVAVSPDGGHLYVTNFNSSGEVSAFSIDATTGALTPTIGSPFAAGTNPLGVGMTPDGSHLYVANELSDDVSAYSIDATTGALTQISGSPFPAHAAPFGATVTPDGGHLYVGNQSSQDVSAFSIDATTGSLSAVTGSPFASGGGAIGSAVSADGGHLYSGNDDNTGTVAAFSIAADGSLTAVTGSPFLTGGSFPSAVALTPDQAPNAAFSAGSVTIGQPTSFDATASSASSGQTVASYNWDFGDGTTQTTSSPTTTHTYATTGNHTATLTVTDNAGCSTAKVFTGQTMSCNGSSAASISHQAAVAKASPTLSTNASPGVVVGAGQIHDTATISAGDSPTGQLTFSLYGPGDSNCTGTPVFTDTKTAAGDAAYDSAGYTPTAPGVYRWTASYSGDANNNASSSPCNAANESVTVSAGAPTLTTNASPGVALGGTAHDTATLSGGSSPSGQITFNLYDRDDEACSGPPIFTDQKPVSGNGDYQSADFTPTGIGTYLWIASYSGDQNNDAASTACNEGSESVTVSEATISTFRLDPDTFAATNKPTPLGPPLPKGAFGTPKGSQIKLTLDAPTLVHFFVRRNGAPPPSHHRKRHGFNRQLAAGANSIPFTANLYGHKLRPGKYHLYARAVSSNSGRRFKRLSTPFTLVGG